MKKIIIIFIFLFFICGCNNQVEINNIAVITGMIIDFKNDEYNVTIETIVSEDDKKIKIFKESGSSIDEVLAKLSKTSNKELFISHLKTLIITKNIINNNINFYDYFLRNPKSKLNFNIYLIDNDIDIFNENESLSLYLDDLIDYNTKTFASSENLSFIDYIYKLYEPGLDILYPKLNYNNKNLLLNNLSFIVDDEEIILNDIDFISFNILKNNINKTNFNIDCDNGILSLALNSSKTKYNYHNNNLYIDVNIDSFINSNSCNINLSNNESLNNLINISKIQIKNNLINLIEISKKYNYDFLGIGNYIYKHNYDEYNKFDLNNLNIIVNVNLFISSIGETRK